MKALYRGLHIEGYKWVLYDDESGLHTFQRPIKQRWQDIEDEPGVQRLVRDDKHGWHMGMWEYVLATTADIENGNAEWMMANGYTLPPCYRKAGDICTHEHH